MNDLNAVAQWAGSLLASLRLAARRQLAAEIAKNLRRINQRRIAAQQGPDGAPFAPRKSPPRHRAGKGRLRKDHAMFRKLRTAAWMKYKATPDAAIVQFVGFAGHIAAVHHYGLRDTVNARRGIAHDFTQRELLGISPDDSAAIAEYVIQHLAQHLPGL